MDASRKRRVRQFAWVLAAVVFWGVGITVLLWGRGGGSPEAEAAEAVVQKFHDAQQKGDWDGMIACMAPGMRRLYDEMREDGWAPTTLCLLGPTKAKVERFKIKGSKVTGEWAEVSVRAKLDGKRKAKTIKTHKIDGQWFLDETRAEKELTRQWIEMIKDWPND